MVLMRYLFSFHGRLSRAKYCWLFWGWVTFCGFVIMVIMTVQPPSWVQRGIQLILMLVLNIGGTSMSVRRAHDLGKPGLWLLYYAASIWDLPFKKGEAQANRFGPAP